MCFVTVPKIIKVKPTILIKYEVTDECKGSNAHTLDLKSMSLQPDVQKMDFWSKYPLTLVFF